MFAKINVDCLPVAHTREPMRVQLRQATINVACYTDLRQWLAIGRCYVKPPWTYMTQDKSNGGRIALDAAPLTIRKSMA